MSPSIPYLIPPERPLPGTSSELGAEGTRAALVGVPFDFGVHLVGGRVGAKQGPAAFREYLAEHLGKPPVGLLDLGMVEVVENQDVAQPPSAGKVETTHDRVTNIVATLIRQGVVPILIGGGHDITYAGVAALAAATEGPIGGINLDAHLDVRPVVDGRISSGTPFRRILENLSDRIAGRNFVEIGIQPGCRPDHRKFLERLGAKIHFIDEVNQKGLASVIGGALKTACRDTSAAFLSVDIDSISERYAPGCSAPCKAGLHPEDVAAAVRLAAAMPALRYFDIMEINPVHDVDGKTLATATAVFRAILEGLAKR
jgi:formimidoylglutamase